MIVEHYIQLLWYYRRLVMAIIVGITGAVAGLSTLILYMSPSYTGSAKVMILPTEAELTFTKGWLGSSQFSAAKTLVETHIEYLISKPVAERALAKMNERLPPPPPPPTGWRADAAEVFSSFKKTLRQTYNILNSGRHIPPTPEQEALDTLMQGIDIEAVEGSYLLQLEVELRDPVAAAVATNALAEAYVEQVSEEASTAAEALSEYFQKEIANRKASLDVLEDREYQLRRELGILELANERQILTESRDKENERLVNIRIEREELEARLQAFEGDRGDLQRRGVLAKVDEEIALSNARRRALETREEMRLQSIAELEERLAELAEKEEPLQDLLRDISRLEVEISDLRDRMIGVSLAGSGALSQVRIIDPATAPVYPSFPKVVLYTVLAFAGSILIAIFVLVAVDTVSDSVKTTADLRRLAGRRGLGVLPPRMLKQLAAPDWQSNEKLHRKLKEFGTVLEPNLAALGDFGAPAIQITGFGSPNLISGVARSIAGALAAVGNTVSYLPASSCNGKEAPVGAIDKPFELSDGSTAAGGPIRIKCVGPVSASLNWQEIGEYSPTLVCVFEAGTLSEAAISEFSENKSRSGISAVSFVMVEA